MTIVIWLEKTTSLTAITALQYNFILQTIYFICADSNIYHYYNKTNINDKFQMRT